MSPGVKLALTAAIAVLTLPAGVADARPATHSEKSKMTSALKHEVRAARNPRCKLGDFRISSGDEIYGTVTIKCRGTHGVYSEPLMERSPHWHIVEGCVPEAIGEVLNDLNGGDWTGCEEEEPEPEPEPLTPAQERQRECANPSEILCKLPVAGGG